ncbi:hypothetical protein CHELA1G11_13546 [Hyphomicrobiales bacterium]|nr:hypothetical protein CHELA1G2_10771 [Hyphomicrobiales bacterium]CAH1672432.1 hypothetical protein CHELA1G11_13546 [Hyphomicrobiales bacterium]
MEDFGIQRVESFRPVQPQDSAGSLIVAFDYCHTGLRIVLHLVPTSYHGRQATSRSDVVTAS